MGVNELVQAEEWTQDPQLAELQFPKAGCRGYLTGVHMCSER